MPTEDWQDPVTSRARQLQQAVMLVAGHGSHVHYEKDGRVHGVDVWVSAEAFHTFVESTLQAAIGKVAAAHGIDLSQAGEPEFSITEVHRLVH